jgi:hypothetical protein
MARDPPGAQEVVSITGENELGTSLELGSTGRSFIRLNHRFSFIFNKILELIFNKISDM